MTENNLRINFICPETPLKPGDVIGIIGDIVDREQLATVYSNSGSVLITIDGRFTKDLALLEKADPAPISQDRLKGGAATFDEGTLRLLAEKLMFDIPTEGVKAEGFKPVRAQEAISFTFAKAGEGRFQVILDRKTGERISVSWSPEQPKRAGPN
ncbi:MAG: hypothetical protein M0D55_15955 [Elusimicrobiota bacterium]|nr:MAG: hypothetical protein M0D55_15955 [Elusimicrobiota bacterium]